MNINDTLQFQNVGLPEDILRMKHHGDYENAIKLIDIRLKDENLPQCLRYCLQVQREMMVRMPIEFPYTYDEALAIIREHIPDFSKEEMDDIIAQRKIRWSYVNGQFRIFNRFFSSLVKAYKGFAQRAKQTLPGVESAVGGIPLLDYSMGKMQENGAMTNRIRIRASVKVKDEVFTPGMFIRAHLPIPSACEQQRDIRIEKCFPENAQIAPEDALQRTICWEETMEENHEFWVEYSYTHTAVYHDLEGQTAKPGVYDFDTEEQAPHIVFTPYIRALVAELSEGITDPLEKARAFYDFITKNMSYTFMPSYFLLESIPDTCAQNFNGDCGVFALLFLTMCRCAGIPAQWQSGFAAEPDFCGGHDWVRFYVEPQGWLFADCSYGVAANRNENEARRKFYFGNLDPYRMVANSAFAAPFTVRKEHWRADPYDNQVGEMETADRGLTYEEYERSKVILQCEEI